MAIWLNGERSDAPPTAFDLSDRGLLLGDGLFDTALVIEGNPVYRNEHLLRLEEACRAIRLVIDPTLLSAALDTAAAGLAFGSVRLTVTRGPGSRGLSPQNLVRPTIIASNANLTAGVAFKPQSLWQSSIRRNETSPCSRMKTLGYLDAVLANAEAKENGCDDAYFLNTRGCVVCAATCNLFMLTDRALVTPPLQEGALPGVTRAIVMRLARELGLEGHERPIDPGDLAQADAVFVTNSLKLIAPVERLGERRIRRGSGEIVAQLAAALCEDIGRTCRLDPGPYLCPDLAAW